MMAMMTRVESGMEAVCAAPSTPSAGWRRSLGVSRWGFYSCRPAGAKSTTSRRSRTSSRLSGSRLPGLNAVVKSGSKRARRGIGARRRPLHSACRRAAHRQHGRGHPDRKGRRPAWSLRPGGLRRVHVSRRPLDDCRPGAGASVSGRHPLQEARSWRHRPLSLSNDGLERRHAVLLGETIVLAACIHRHATEPPSASIVWDYQVTVGAGGLDIEAHFAPMPDGAVATDDDAAPYLHDR